MLLAGVVSVVLSSVWIFGPCGVMFLVSAGRAGVASVLAAGNCSGWLLLLSMISAIKDGSIASGSAANCGVPAALSLFSLLSGLLFLGLRPRRF